MLQPINDQACSDNASGVALLSSQIAYRFNKGHIQTCTEHWEQGLFHDLCKLLLWASQDILHLRNSAYFSMRKSGMSISRLAIVDEGPRHVGESTACMQLELKDAWQL